MPCLTMIPSYAKLATTTLTRDALAYGTTDIAVVTAETVPVNTIAATLAILAKVALVVGFPSTRQPGLPAMEGQPHFVGLPLSASQLTLLVGMAVAGTGQNSSKGRVIRWGSPRCHSPPKCALGGHPMVHHSTPPVLPPPWIRMTLMKKWFSSTSTLTAVMLRLPTWTPLYSADMPITSVLETAHLGANLNNSINKVAAKVSSTIQVLALMEKIHSQGLWVTLLSSG